jgi:Zn-dependent protease with chaperone function
MMAAIPCMALVQTLVFQMQVCDAPIAWEQKEDRAHRLWSFHSAIWLIASVALIGATQWQNVVRSNWQLNDWPLVDEMLILAPVIFSLLASWAVLYQIQVSQSTETPSLLNRLKFVTARFRIQIAVVLVPIFGTIVIRDLWRNFCPWSSSVAFLFLVAAIVALLASYPYLLTLIWRTQPLRDVAVRDRFLQLCRDHKMSVSNIRVWLTDHQIVNAVIAGIFPKLRVLMVSDGLIQTFPEHEVKAVLRHEAGHIRLGHLTCRAMFVILPLVAFAVPELATSFSNPRAVRLGIETSLVEILGVAAFCIYVALINGWLSRNMEFEADLYAAEALSVRSSSQERPTQNSQRDMVDALLRFVYLNPSQFSRRSMTHPSLEERLRVLDAARENPEFGFWFHRKFRTKRRIVLGIVCVLAIVAWFSS